MITIQVLTGQGWMNEDQHPTRDMAFWHARAKSDASGQTYRLVSNDQNLVCLLTAKGSDCWDIETELVA
tara:strand:- start:9032 stop:9238 length:207 start_codon:yes stop_codon:yes gene_type:complete